MGWRGVFGLSAALAVAYGAASPALAQGDDDRLLGKPLAVAQTNDLFTYFNLSQTTVQGCGAGKVVGYRSMADRFHRLASVEVGVDEKGAVQFVALRMERSFIDDPADGVFARDIVKSFMRDVAGNHADPQIVALAVEIATRPVPGATTVVVDPAAAPPPGPPSPGYAVLVGDRDRFELTAGGEVLSLEREQLENQPGIRMLITASPPAPVCSIGKVPF